MAAPSIKVTSGASSGAEFEIDRELVLGRENCDVTIPDEEASRRHAAVRPANGGVEVEDLGSLNGTFVDGERLEAPRMITESATVRVGMTTLQVDPAEAMESAAAEDPVASPDVTAPREIPQPDVTAPRQIADPDVTAPRQIADPDVTAPRQVADPDVTAPRATQKGEARPPSPPAHQPPQRVRELAPIVVGGLVCAAVVAVILALLLG
ncbi:MAG TPA: FHA domain-containing protein [Thermoleophilaceae bacterium]|nr:FHA domain-containing protein [Thermoleophilaceae bacterium]